MSRKRRISGNANGADKGKFKGDPIYGRMEEKDAVRFLMHKGASIDAHLTDSELKGVLEKGKLGNNWKLIQKDEYSNPRVVGVVDAEGVGSVKISMELSAGRFEEFISGTLLRAGLPKDFVIKVAEVETAMHKGDVILVNELCNFEPKEKQ